MVNPQVFQQLQKLNGRYSTQASTKNSNSQSFFSFQIGKNDYGYYVITCDQQHQSQYVDEHFYQGAVRQAITLYNRLSNTISWDISWEKEDDYLYLHEHPDLLEAILDCSSYLTLQSTQQTVRFNPETGSIILSTRQTENQDAFICQTVFQAHKKSAMHPVDFLTPSLVLADHRYG